jgi:hypothetical protein
MVALVAAVAVSLERQGGLGRQGKALLVALVLVQAHTVMAEAEVPVL